MRLQFVSGDNWFLRILLHDAKERHDDDGTLFLVEMSRTSSPSPDDVPTCDADDVIGPPFKCGGSCFRFPQFARVARTGPLDSLPELYFDSIAGRFAVDAYGNLFSPIPTTGTDGIDERLIGTGLMGRASFSARSVHGEGDG